MATITFNGESFTVDHAVKGDDFVHGYDAAGNCIISIDGVSDFSDITYTGDYMEPGHCLAEVCNDVKYCGGMLKTAGGKQLGVSSPNLLDNWYFVDPINQRGQEYYDSAAQYTIDRWHKGVQENSVVSLWDGGGLEMNAEGCTSAFYVRQRFEQPLPAGTYTLSFMVTAYNENGRPYIYLSDNNGVTVNNAGKSVTGLGLFSVTATIPADTVYRVQMTIPAGSMMVLESIKLEKGAMSTLANDPPPNKAQELAKCQRYQISIFPATGTYIAGMGMASSATKANLFLALPVTLRATPVVTFSNLYLRNVATDISSQVTDVTEYGKTANGDWLLLTASGLTAGDTYFLRSESGSLLLDANL